jgi:hypothetical protein
MPRPGMTHEQIWEVIAGLGMQEDAVYQHVQETHTKIRHSQRDQDGKSQHWMDRLADLNARAERITELRGRLRGLVEAGHRPESMEWDV